MDYKKPKMDGIKRVPDRERYPHMHDYAEIDYAWIYKMLSILKKWAQTLSHWIAVLQETETEDMLEVEEQLQKLLDKIGVWIESLTAALDNLTKAELQYQQAELGYQQAEDRYQQAEKFYQTQEALAQVETVSMIQEAAQMLVSLTEYLSKAITEAAPLFTELFECIENRLKIHDGYIGAIFDSIEEIMSYIQNIYDILENIINQNTTSTLLTFGTDYALHWYNGWYSGDEASAPRITLMDQTLKSPQSEFHSLTASIRISTTYRIYNDHVYTAGVADGPQFQHSSTIEQVPESRIVGIEFLDRDKFTNYINYTQTGNQIFNMRPVDQRASWDVGCANKHRDNIDIISMVTLSDGYNQQYYNHYDSGLYFGVPNINMELYYNYSI